MNPNNHELIGPSRYGASPVKQGVEAMEAVFCKKYLSLFQQWKNRLEYGDLNADEFHTATKKFFLRCVNFQFCIENSWADFEVSKSMSSIYSTILRPLFSSLQLQQSNLFHLSHPELESVPDALVWDVFGPEGLFQGFSFCSDEFVSNKAFLTPAIMATLFEELVQDRHEQGTYYTSSDVVRFMAQKSLDKRLGANPSAKQLLNARIIDPACGSGALLLGTAEEIYQLSNQVRLSLSNFEYKLHLVENCLYGIDLEQAALDVTQTRFWYWLNVGEILPQPFEDRNFVQGNSVTGSNPQEECQEIGFEFRQQFPEIFVTESPGFDIVIANPPYVRQESIDKGVKEHVRSQKIFSGSISGMSDLYAYFYARATQLLKPGGVSSFICSNTWMDVHYGRLLQKEFLEHFSDIEILGSKLLRQFTTAEINTVITFMCKKVDMKSTVQFTLLNADFKSSIELYSNQSKRSILQSELLDLGMKDGTYMGSKWSLYLHAPSFYHRLILDKKDQFISIQDLCQRTLRNNLRVLPKGYSVQSVPASGPSSLPYVQSFKDIDSIKVVHDKQRSVVHPELQSSLLKSTYCRPDFVANRFYNARMFFIEGGDYFVSDSFFLGKLKEHYRTKEVLLSLNSTISLLFLEIGGRKGLGGGLLSFYGPEFRSHLTLDPAVFSCISASKYHNFVQREIHDVFEECGFDKRRASLSIQEKEYLSLRSQQPNPMPDRKEIDRIAFDALNLSLEERNEVYWSLCESVLSRLHKASSV